MDEGLVTAMMESIRRGGFRLRAKTHGADMSEYLRECETMLMVELATMPDAQLRPIVEEEVEKMLHALGLRV